MRFRYLPFAGVLLLQSHGDPPARSGFRWMNQNWPMKVVQKYQHLFLPGLDREKKSPSHTDRRNEGNARARSARQCTRQDLTGCVRSFIQPRGSPIVE